MSAPSTLTLDVGDTREIQDWMRAVQARVVTDYLERVWLHEATDPDTAAKVLQRAFGLPADEHAVIGYCDAMARAHPIDADPVEWARDNAPEGGTMPGPTDLASWALERRDGLWQDADRFMRQIVGAV